MGSEPNDEVERLRGLLVRSGGCAACGQIGDVSDEVVYHPRSYADLLSIADITACEIAGDGVSRLRCGACGRWFRQSTDPDNFIEITTEGLTRDTLKRASSVLSSLSFLVPKLEALTEK